jgi:hypothetical protein
VSNQYDKLFMLVKEDTTSVRYIGNPVGKRFLKNIESLARQCNAQLPDTTSERFAVRCFDIKPEHQLFRIVEENLTSNSLRYSASVAPIKAVDKLKALAERYNAALQRPANTRFAVRNAAPEALWDFTLVSGNWRTISLVLCIELAGCMHSSCP